MSNKELADVWALAGLNPGQPIEIGRLVVCDSCSRDYTDSAEVGGFVFGSKGYCPGCAPRMLASIKRYGEERYIKATCPDGVPFADFIREYRGPDSTVTITPIKRKEDL